MKPVDRAISQIIAPRMRALDFSRRHHTWNRRLFARVQVVNIQKSIDNTEDRVRFTVNLGQRLAIGLRADTWLRATDCRPEPRRLGFLTPARQDTWYQCDPNDALDVERAVRACLADLDAYGLPWLDGLPASDAALPQAPDAAIRERGGGRLAGVLRWIGWLRKQRAPGR